MATELARDRAAGAGGADPLRIAGVALADLATEIAARRTSRARAVVEGDAREEPGELPGHDPRAARRVAERLDAGADEEEREAEEEEDDHDDGHRLRSMAHCGGGNWRLEGGSSSGRPKRRIPVSPKAAATIP